MTRASDTMPATLNKQLLMVAFTEAAQGNPSRFRELYADDVRWTTIGTTRWSGTFAGKQAVREMFERLYPLFAERIVITPLRFIAEDDLVAVEGRGRATTRTGKAYNNSYCLVFRMAAGKIKEITEYCDTALIDAVL